MTTDENVPRDGAVVNGNLENLENSENSLENLTDADLAFHEGCQESEDAYQATLEAAGDEDLRDGGADARAPWNGPDPAAEGMQEDSRWGGMPGFIHADDPDYYEIRAIVMDVHTMAATVVFMVGMNVRGVWEPYDMPYPKPPEGWPWRTWDAPEGARLVAIPMPNGGGIADVQGRAGFIYLMNQLGVGIPHVVGRVTAAGLWKELIAKIKSSVRIYVQTDLWDDETPWGLLAREFLRVLTCENAHHSKDNLPLISREYATIYTTSHGIEALAAPFTATLERISKQVKNPGMSANRRQIGQVIRGLRGGAATSKVVKSQGGVVRVMWIPTGCLKRLGFQIPDSRDAVPDYVVDDPNIAWIEDARNAPAASDE